MTLAAKVNALRDEIGSLYLERNEQINGLFLAILAGEHVLLLGPPGTAKSAAICTLINRIAGANMFELLLTKFTPPEEVFGPASIIGLQQDKYERVIDSYLPTADVGFIDEVFKANSAILNSLLTIMAERKFKNGKTSIKVPLVSLVGASNETPQDESLSAMYDRFMLKYVTAYVTDGNFPTLMRLRSKIAAAEADPNKTTISLADLKQAQSEVEAITIPAPIYEQLSTLRTSCRNEGLSASDRRWMGSEKILKACAWMDGRKNVISDDLLIYKDILWDNMGDVGKCAVTVGRIINPTLTQIQEHVDQIDMLLKEFVGKGGKEEDAITALVKIKKHTAKLDDLQSGPKGEQLKNKIQARIKSAIGKTMGF